MQHVSKSTSWRVALSREDHDTRKLSTRAQIWRHVGGPVPRLPPPTQCLLRFCSPRHTMQLHLWYPTSATPLDGAQQLHVDAAWAVSENQPAQDPAAMHSSISFSAWSACCRCASCPRSFAGLRATCKSLNTTSALSSFQSRPASRLRASSPKRTYTEAGHIAGGLDAIPRFGHRRPEGPQHHRPKA